MYPKMYSKLFFVIVCVFAFSAAGVVSATYNGDPMADLRITKSGPSAAEKSEGITYTIRVTNDGPDEAKAVVVSDEIPSGLVFSSSSGATCQKSSNFVDCYLGDLSDGATRTFRINYNFRQTFACDSDVNNRASVDSDTYDANTSNNESANIVTTVSCEENCTSHSSVKCVGNSAYWYDSCGNQQELMRTCGQNQACSHGSCVTIACSSDFDCGTSQYTGSPYCQNGNVYQNYGVHRCNNPGQTGSFCTYSTENRLKTSCSSGQTCQSGSCQATDSYGNCASHAYRSCIGNAIYWYNSCGNQQELVQYCNAPNQICQYGQCASKPAPPYVPQYRTACYGTNIHWYDSNGKNTGLYKSCSDANSCTQDSCYAGKCANTLKCDGLTCPTGSEDYKKYCPTAPENKCGNGQCEASLGETPAVCPADCKTEPNISGLSISFFVKSDPDSNQWQKTAGLGQNSTIYFMVSVANNGSSAVDNLNASALIPAEISSLGNLRVDNVQVSGDIVSGISVGSLAPLTTKLITFEGRSQTFSEQGSKEAKAAINLLGAEQSDTVTITLNPNQTGGAAVSGAPGFWAFLKRWYLWIFVGLVLLFLFVIVFRRLSSNA